MEKKVFISGMWVEETQVSGRLAALERGRRLHQDMVAAQEARRAEEADKLRKQGYKEDEINVHFSATRIKDLEIRGFGTSRRAYPGPSGFIPGPAYIM